MASGGVLGFGTKVAFSNSSPVSWTAVPQILDITFPGLNPDEVETTVHGTLPYKRFMRGLIDVSELTLTLELDLASNSVHRTLRTLQLNGTTVWWRIEVPENRERTSWVAFEFQGWVKSWVPSTPIADKQTLEVSIRFDGTDFAMYAPGTSQIS
jgi:hypothetical protein